MLIDNSTMKILGLLKITDAQTGEIVIEKTNLVHPENLSLALAKSLGHKSGGYLDTMRFGNGASTVSGIGIVTYLTPNVVGSSAGLYNPTYSKIIDDQNPLNLDPTRNRIDISHVTGNLFSDIIISCYLDNGEPSGQSALDNTPNINAPFVFDELALYDYDGLLLTHCIFSPVEKSLNRIFSISYTLRVQSV